MDSTGSPPTSSYLSNEELSDSSNFTEETPYLYTDENANIFYFETPEDMRNPSKRHPAFYPIIITHAITFVLGIVGNVIAVLVMVGDRKGRNATNLFLVSLAVADLLLLLFCVPLEVLLYFLQFEDNWVLCKTSRYIELLSASASVLNLCAVSLERFIVIVFPMRSRSVCTLSNCRKAICFVWVFAMVLSLPVMLTTEGYSVTYTNNITSVSVFYCEEASGSEGLPIAIYKFVILFAAPALLMMICYVYVIRELWRSTRNINILTNSKSIRSASSTHNTGEKAALNNSRISSPSESRTCFPSKGGKQLGGQHQQAQQLTVSVNPMIHHNNVSGSSSSLRASQKINCALTPGNGEASSDNGINGNTSGGTGAGKKIHNNGHTYTTISRAGGKDGGLKGNCHHQSMHRRALNQTRPHKGEDAKKARRQVIKMLILIIILFLVCWGPKLILNITLKLALIFGLPIYSPEVYNCRLIFSLIPFVHSCINPIVYSFMSKNFRRSMNRQLGRCCTACGCKCRNNCGQHRHSIPLRSTARTRTTQAVESTYSSNYCQLSEINNTRHTDIEGISAI